MSNYKIRVNSKAKSKEAQQLFFELGYEKGVCSTGGYPALIIATPESRFQKTPYSSRATSLNHESHSQYKEITLPELRDMVVLKRNDVGDATHTDGRYSFYVGKDKNYFFSSCDKAWRGTWKNVEILKPIEKPMKEYLRKNSNDTYSYIGTVRPEHVSDSMIEIPEGATYYAKDASLGKSGNFFFRLRSDDFDFEAVWLDSNWIQAIFNVENQDVLWQRNNNQTIASAVESSHPEELPFIDDEPSLNDQYAEIEKVRQSAWQKQEGGSHYKNLKIQPMQYALENKLDYAQANVVKYVTRHKEKNGKEDLLKAIHNIELMIEFYYGDEK